VCGSAAGELHGLPEQGAGCREVAQPQVTDAESSTAKEWRDRGHACGRAEAFWQRREVKVAKRHCCLLWGRSEEQHAWRTEEHRHQAVMQGRHGLKADPLPPLEKLHFPQALATRKVLHLASVAAEKEAEAGKPMHQKGP